MSRRKRSSHEEEEHENHERWLVTYADMITLLMVLFIVLYSMSIVDQKKFNALRAGLAAGFGQSTSVLDGSSSILADPGTSVAQPISPQEVEETPEVQEIKVQAVTAERVRQRQEAYDEAEAEARRLTRLERRLLAALRRQGLEGDVVTGIDGRGLTVSLVSRHVVFDLDLATLTPRGRRILDVVAPVLRSVDDQLSIEGHTNQAPGAPRYYASDWDLSSARAVTVLRYLDERRGLPSERLAAVGYGKVRPLVDPTRPGSQAVNKRVDIVVLSRLAEEGAALLDRVGEDRTDGHAAGEDGSSHGDGSGDSPGDGSGDDGVATTAQDHGDGNAHDESADETDEEQH